MKKLILLSILIILSNFISNAQCTISGVGSICVGSSAVVSVDTSVSGCPGGAWSSSNPSIANIDSIVTASIDSLGDSTYTEIFVVYGNSVGVVTISYTSGAGISTALLTVNPLPAAITGTTSLCIGTSSTLADITTGGTWSSGNTSIATISSSGVVTGISSGNTYIYYSTGCYNAVNVTIETVFTGDSSGYSAVEGSTSVCAGATTPFFCYTPGGTWSSSNTAIATVGTSTGIVTGIASGVANISYSVTDICGTGSAYLPVTVNPASFVGSISGPVTTTVSSSITLSVSSTFSTIYWSSLNPTIASINISGVVTGISPGTATIQCIVNTCTTSDTLLTTVTVTSLDGISGNVIFSFGYSGNVIIWLITFNTSTLNLEAVDSATVFCSGTSCYYSFTGLATDSFRVKAALDNDSTSITSNFIPTYHDSSYHWDSAEVIYHVAGTSDINKNINMQIGSSTTGIGFIAGNVLTGANKGTSGSVPVVELLVYIMNSATGRELQRTYTDASGNYSFGNLPIGTTYFIYPEKINYTTTTYSGITLTATFDSMKAANFLQHNIVKTITPVFAGINNITPSLSSVGVFPNPTTDKVTLQWNEIATEKGMIRVTDMTGRELFKTSVEMNSGNGASQLDLSSLSGGLYIISVKSGTINYNTTVSISK